MISGQSVAPLSAEEIAKKYEVLAALNTAIEKHAGESGMEDFVQTRDQLARLLATLTARDEIIAGLTARSTENAASHIKSLDNIQATVKKLETEYYNLDLERKRLFESHDELDTLLGAAMDRTETAEARVKVLEEALRELYAMIKGECPSLLNEDSGGNARLDMAIESALSPSNPVPTDDGRGR